MTTVADIIDHVAEAADISKAAAKRAIDALHESITSTLQKDESITFVGFGTYATSHRAAREGRNPQTGETIQIRASIAAKFKAGKKLKDALNS